MRFICDLVAVRREGGCAIDMTSAGNDNFDTGIRMSVTRKQEVLGLDLKNPGSCCTGIEGGGTGSREWRVWCRRDWMGRR